MWLEIIVTLRDMYFRRKCFKLFKDMLQADRAHQDFSSAGNLLGVKSHSLYDHIRG